MVRQVRLCRDEIDGLDPSQSPRDSFDDLDDLVLDTVTDRSRRRPVESTRRRRKPAPDVRRHLADADWLRDVPRPKPPEET